MLNFLTFKIFSKHGGKIKMSVVSEVTRGKGVGFSRIRRITGVRRVL